MSTAITTAMDNGGSVAQSADGFARSQSALGGNREAFRTAVSIATALSESNIMPAAYHGNLANCMVALEYANRLGASVLAVAQNLDVIHGRPSLRAKFLIGTVNASGRFTPLRFRWQGEEGSDEWGCRAVAKDKETGEECVGPLITIGLAKAEKWYQRSGSKWQTLAELMIMYRAGAWWTNVYCPELSLGLSTTEESYDIGPALPGRSVGSALNQRIEALSPGAPAEPVPSRGTDEASEVYAAVLRSIIEYVTHTEAFTSGAEAKSADVDKARALVVEVFEDGTDEREAVSLWLDAETLGAKPVAELVQRLESAKKARAEFEQPSAL